jgi:hypothetical protein
MKLTEVFPSNYLKSEDLQGQEITVTIARCAMEKLGDDDKLVIHFRGKEKGMVCNKTNANRIAHYFGDDTDNWIGKQIILGTELVDFQGRTTEAIRVRGRSTPAASVEAQAPAAKAEEPFDTEVPF